LDQSKTNASFILLCELWLPNYPQGLGDVLYKKKIGANVSMLVANNKANFSKKMRGRNFTR
jgi:hypothetical protein